MSKLKEEVKKDTATARAKAKLEALLPTVSQRDKQFKKLSDGLDYSPEDKLILFACFEAGGDWERGTCWKGGIDLLTKALGELSGQWIESAVEDETPLQPAVDKICDALRERLEGFLSDISDRYPGEQLKGDDEQEKARAKAVIDFTLTKVGGDKRRATDVLMSAFAEVSTEWIWAKMEKTGLVVAEADGTPATEYFEAEDMVNHWIDGKCNDLRDMMKSDDAAESQS